MYFTDDSLLPKNQEKLVIAVALMARNGSPAIFPKTFRSAGTSASVGDAETQHCSRNGVAKRDESSLMVSLLTSAVRFTGCARTLRPSNLLRSRTDIWLLRS
jgi:hypothetical protein